MTPDQTNKALDSVRNRLGSMLDRLEKMKAEQEDDLKSASDQQREKTEISLAQTKKLIDEIKKSQINIEDVLKNSSIS